MSGRALAPGLVDSPGASRLLKKGSDPLEGVKKQRRNTTPGEGQTPFSTAC